MDFAKVLDADFGVNGGGFELFVAEELLDDADVGPAFEHVGGAAVAQKMAAAGATDAGLLEGLADASAEDVGTEGRAVDGEEEGGFCGVEFEAWADFQQVFPEPVQGTLADGDDAVLAAFGVAEVESLALGVVVAEGETDQFAAADAGGREEFQNGAVADA